MTASAALPISIGAILIAGASLGVSIWQGTLNWLRFRGERSARLAIDPSSVSKTEAGWTVELFLTNVGRSHARRVTVWLEDEMGNSVGETPVSKPLLSGSEPRKVTIHVVDRDHGLQRVVPVRRFRDEEGEKDDRSAQMINLT
jgi:hypothetical protein